jgi:hypothetical protein
LAALVINGEQIADAQIMLEKAERRADRPH